MHTVKVGLQLRPQLGTMDDMRRTWEEADRLGADSIWTWDHFFPLPVYGASEGPHFEGYTVLAAMAATTKRAQFGMMVTCNSYRNPNLLADMARTVDHISGGRHILGIGSGWFERDYVEYGYPFKTAPERLRDLAEALPIIEERLAKLDPGPVNGKLPILIGGSGEKVTLRLVAKHADMWNSFGTPDQIGAKSQILDEWCAKLGRDPGEIERTLLRGESDVLDNADEYVKRGVTHLIVGTGGPDYNLDLLKRMLEWRDKRSS